METWNKYTKFHAYKLCLLKIQEAMCATNKCVESSTQFVSVFTNSSPINSPDLGPSLHLPMEAIAVNIFSVTELLRYLKSHKATWLIQFNPSKCQVVRVITKQESISVDSYTIHGGTLEEAKSAKYFGLNLDNKVNFNTHVTFMLLLRRPTQLLLFLDATCTTAAGKSKRLPIRSMWDPSLNTHPHT